MSTREGSSSSIFKVRGPLDPVNDSAISAPRPELDQILSAVNAPTVDAYIAILSSRQTGKTSLLYQVRQRVRPRGIGVVLLDLSLGRDQPEVQLYRFVAGEMLSELEPNMPRRAEKREAAALPGNPIEFRRFLLDTARQARSTRILLLMDEVEAVPDKYSDAFFGTLRNIFSSRRKEDEIAFEKYLIVFSGARELHRLTTGPNSPLNIAERIYLRDLDVDGVNVIAANFKRAGIVAPEGTAAWLYAQASGHPYLTQKLCAQIEQWHPPSVTPEMVQRAATEILRSDDHLEKLISQVDVEPAAQDMLRRIVTGAHIPFSRLKSPLARLELLGAIRDAGQQAAVRNAIYLSAFRAHFGVAAADASRGFQPRQWVRPLAIFIALVVLLLNLPFLYVYARDVLFATRSVNDVFAPPALGARAVIRYDRVLRANDPTPTGITVDIDQFASSTPITVTFQHSDLDIAGEGEARRRFDPPAHRERFAFSLNQSGLPYNPFQLEIPHRRIDLVFESPVSGAPAQTYTADFLVDYYSAAILSAALTLGGVIAFFAALWGNVDRLRRGLGLLSRFAKTEEK
ncbi:MAG TPA: AAA-like domain-containing protein [Anaerolineae bacterium]